MKALEEKILKEGTILPGNILKVGSFLNHRIDAAFMMEMGKEIARLRCEQKLLKKKKKRFMRKAKDTALNAEDLRRYVDKLIERANSYVETALSCDEKIAENEKKLSELVNN